MKKAKEMKEKMAYEEYGEFGVEELGDIEYEALEEAEDAVGSMSDEEVEQMEEVFYGLESGEIRLDELSVEEMGFFSALLPGLISAAPRIIGGIRNLFSRRRRGRTSRRRPSRVGRPTGGQRAIYSRRRMPGYVCYPRSGSARVPARRR